MTLRAFLRELAVFGVYLLLTIVLTWPLASRLSTAVSDDGDPLLNVWIVDWDCYALTHAPLSIYKAPIFHPAHLPLAFSENLIGVALLALPFHLFGASPLTVYNLMVLLGFALSAYGGYVLARVTTRNLPASLLAGIFYGFVSFKFDHLSHLQFLCSEWLPLMLAALLVYRREPIRRNMLLLGAAFVMNGLTNVHYFLFGSFTLVMTIAVFVLIGAVRWNWRWWLRLGGTLAVGGLLLLPMLIPYKIVSREYKMKRWEGEALSGSATWSDWIVATPPSVAYGAVADKALDHPERHLFPGLLSLFLLGVAIVVTPRREALNDVDPHRFRAPNWLLRTLDVIIVAGGILAYIGSATLRWAPTFHGRVILAISHSDVPMVVLLIAVAIRLMLQFPLVAGGGTLSDRYARSRFGAEGWAGVVWIVVGFLGSFGLNGFFHTFLYRRIEMFQSVRAPARWAIITYVGLTIWTALGAAALFRARRVWRYAALFALALLDVAPRIRWFYMTPQVAPAYRWMNESRSGPTLELPVTGEHFNPYYYMLAATAHHVPILNGISGFEPPVHHDLADRGMKLAFDDAYTKLLEDVGCRFVLVHADWLYNQTPAVQRWLRAQTASGRLRFLRRFDSGVSGDWMFAVAKNVPDWQRFHENGRDAAGFTAEENLARLVDNQPTYNRGTFGRLDLPRSDVYQGAMHVAGWALSPNGIRDVRVLFDAGRYRYQAWLVPRGDVAQLYPWYRNASLPGFDLTIPKRPKGMSKESDIQIEIVDGKGNVTRLPDVWITWD